MSSSELLNSRETEMSVLGTILYDSSIFSRASTSLVKDDFYHPEHARVFSAMESLHNDNLDINVKSVWNYLYAKNYNGITETEIRDMLDYRVDGEAFQSFTAQLAEFSGHRILSSGLRKVQSELEKKSGTLDSYSSSLASLIRQVNAKDVRADFATGEDMGLSFMEMLSRERSNLAYTGLPSIDDRLVDFDGKEISYIAARPGTGKALPLDAPVLTPTGWVKMGDIREGDMVIGGDGTRQRVSGVYPQGLRDEYAIEFSDGTVATADLEHLWVTKSRRERRSVHNGSSGKLIRAYNERPFTTKTTKEIMESLRVGTDNRLNHSVPYVGVVDFEPQEITVEPYTLGLYLGDGDCSGPTVRITTGEDEIRSHLEEHYPGSYRPHSNSGTYRFSNGPILPLINDLGLNGLRSWEKFIPEQYINNTVEVRLSVLQGLLDTDGYVNNSTSIEYSTTSPMLRDGIIEIARSLGGRATFKERVGRYLKDDRYTETRTNYRVTLSFPEGISPFRLTRKAEMYRPVSRITDKYITNVSPTGRRVEMQCIMVDSEEHTFVTKDYNVTHNTAMMLQSARINLERGARVGFLSMEMSVAKLANRLISAKARYNGEDMLKMSQGEFMSNESLLEAYNWLKSVPLFMDDFGPFTKTSVAQKIRKMVYEHGVDVVYVDYIGLIQIEGNNRNDQLSELSRELKGLSSELDIPLVIASQLSRDVVKRGGGRPNLADLRDSGSLEQDASIVAFLYADTAAISLEGGQDVDTFIKEESTVPVKFEIAKQRNGPVFTRDLVFLKTVGRFELRDHHYSTFPVDDLE